MTCTYIYYIYIPTGQPKVEDHPTIYRLCGLNLGPRRVIPFWSPSGKHTKSYGKSTIFNGKIHYFDWVIFNSYVTNYQRV